MHGGPSFVINDDLMAVAGKNEVATIYDLKTGKTLGDLPGGHRAMPLKVSLWQTGQDGVRKPLETKGNSSLGHHRLTRNG